jgi:transcriptional regulator with XRE-family HTH domain
MQLRQYLDENGIIHRFFAKKIGASPYMISEWMSGKTTPALETIDLIEKETKGKVTFRDWIIAKKNKKQPKEQSK